MGRRYAGAGSAYRARGGAALHLGDGAAGPRRRARALAPRRVAARRAPARSDGGGARRAGWRARPGCAGRRALPLARPRPLGGRWEDAVPRGLPRAGPAVRPGGAPRPRRARARGARRGAAGRRRPAHRPGDRFRLAARARNGGLLELPARALIALALALAACRDQRAAPSRVTVEVLNASGKPGLAKAATRLLRQAGIDVLTFRNAPDSVGALDSTRILVRRGGSPVGERIRKALGTGRVAVEPDARRLLDASVLLGADFAPPRLEFHP